MDDPNFNEDKLWTVPFPTPMIEDAFAFVRDTVANLHPGAVIYAPTGTGKSSFTNLMKSEAVSIPGRRGTAIISTVLTISTNSRYIMSEGGFWGWFLYAFRHASAGKHLPPLEKRFLVYEYVKGLAAQAKSGRVILFVDEAQILGLEELGLLADLLNELSDSGFRLVVFLIGSYHLAHWKADLQTHQYSNIRRRFFNKEHRLLGLATVEDYRRCLRRYDVDTKPLDGKSTIVRYYQPKWVDSGGRLEPFACVFRDAFGGAIANPRKFQVPMAFFALALKELLEQPTFKIDANRVTSAVDNSGFARNYESDTES